VVGAGKPLVGLFSGRRQAPDGRGARHESAHFPAGGIEKTVERIGKQFDTGGLKAVAKEFGVGSGSKTKDAARGNIEEKIKARKGRHERNEAASPVPVPPPVQPAQAPVSAPLPSPGVAPGEPIEAQVDSEQSQ
jgi:hypothetical protein